MKSPPKLCTLKIRWASLVGSTLSIITPHSQEEAMLSRTDTIKKTSIWDPHRACPLRLCLWLWIVYFWYQKCIIDKYSALLNSLSHSSELSNLRAFVGTPKLIASWSEVKVVPGTPNLQLVSEAWAVLRRTAPFTCEAGLHSGSLVSQTIAGSSLLAETC